MTKAEMTSMMERQNKTIIEKNDLIDRLTEKLGYLMKEVNKLQDEARYLRRKHGRKG